MVSVKIISHPGEIPQDLAKLSKMEGIDLITTPSVTALPGEKAVIEITREVIMPKLMKEENETVDAGMVLAIISRVSEDQIVFDAKLTLRKVEKIEGEDERIQAEISAREVHFSETADIGVPLWFHLNEPWEGKRLTVLMKLQQVVS
ncbi:MAG: hypothetical protein ACPGIA_06980 [Luteolibacter sp.]